MIELKKMNAMIAENSRHLDAYRMIMILSNLYSAYVILKNPGKFVFYVNNYFDWDLFNQLYDPDCKKKGIKNADTVACNLGPASTRASNQRLEVSREERRKREEMVEK